MIMVDWNQEIMHYWKSWLEMIAWWHVVTKQTGFIVKLTKSLMFNKIFHLYIFESHDGAVLYTHDMWQLILLL